MKLNKKIIKKFPKIIFPKKIDMGTRIWGKEILLNLVSKKFSLKLLKLKKGKAGGLQFHRKKNECGYLLKGKLLVCFLGKNGKLRSRILKKGDVFHFPPKSIHQEKALADCEIIEASTPHFNDRVRVERFFSAKDLGGLKTTAVKDIKFL
jgi:quercetin dioxygenase-like cupin family protein